MAVLSRLASLWRNLFHRTRVERDLDDELHAYVDLLSEEKLQAGMSPAAARRAATIEAGGVEQIKEEVRDVRAGAHLENVFRDLRYALRSLKRSPGFLAVAVVALGLGLGLSTTMFAVMDNVMHPRSVYVNADRVFFLDERWSVRGRQVVTRDQLYRLVRERVPSLDALVPWNIWQEPISFGGDPREQHELIVPPRWFEVMGIRPEHGRIFTPADGDGVALVSHEVWRGALAGRRNLDGAYVTIGDRSYAVVGVLPHSPRVGAFLPLLPTHEDEQGTMPLVRLKTGASPAQADRELAALADILTRTYASASTPLWLKLFPYLDPNQKTDELHDLRLAMVGSALAVLLIACVNLAHLMLARGVAKRRELALRMALGANRLAAMRVMLLEVTLVATGGLVLGALLAVWGSHVLDALMPYDLSWWGMLQPQLSWRVFALGALAAVGSAVLFGLFPAMRVAISVQITEPLKDEGGNTTGQPQRYSPLVIGEVALALALLMGGALLLRSVHQLRSAPTGFNAETLANAEVGARARHKLGPGTRRDTHPSIDWEQVVTTARAVPGISGAALEMWGRTIGAAVTAEMGSGTTRTMTMQEFRVVSPNYLEVHGLPILKGRNFEPGDQTGDGVAIISAAAAAHLYPRGDAVGRMLKLGGLAATAPWVRVVGVARTPLTPWQDIPDQGGDAPVWVVRPWGDPPHAFVLARAAMRDPATLVRLWHALRTVPGAAAVWVEPYTRARDASIASFTFLAKVFLTMGAIGLGLAALGLYGVMAYAVSRRMREFGVRIALGAEPKVLFRMVMRDGLVMLLTGTGIGAFGALGAAYLFNSILVGVYPTDAVSLLVAEAMLLAVGLAATIVPARQAVRASPIDIIRAV